LAASHAIKVDDKGRLTIPRTLRKELGIEPGDTMFVEREPNGVVLRYAKAENPFDGLARHAEQEYRAGRTKSLRDFASENDISLVDER
jgi:antitoxin PrlF